MTTVARLTKVESAWGYVVWSGDKEFGYLLCASCGGVGKSYDKCASGLENVTFLSAAWDRAARVLLFNFILRDPQTNCQKPLQS